MVKIGTGKPVFYPTGQAEKRFSLCFLFDSSCSGMEVHFIVDNFETVSKIFYCECADFEAKGNIL